MKTIAERALAYATRTPERQYEYNAGNRFDFDTCIEILAWLEAQPENKRMFTIEEVEAIAREAYYRGIRVGRDEDLSQIDFYFANFWQEKKKGMGK